MKPEIFHLARIGWQFFGTLTFKQERLPERVRLAMWFAFVRTMAGKFQVHYSRVLWVLREERGERFGRRHYHYLIGGIPSSFATPNWCFIQCATWERLGGGMARVYVFDQSLNGLDYIAKCLESGLAYETGKFGQETSDLTLSHSTIAYLHGCVRRDRQGVQLTETSKPLPAGPATDQRR